MARPAYRWVSSVAAVSGLIVQFHANQAETKCSQVKKQQSDKFPEKEGSVVYAQTDVFCPRE